MGDTSNWEFAAAVAGVCIGLGGLLLFTLIGAIGSWRLFDKSSRAATEAAKTNVAIQDLARQLLTVAPAGPASQHVDQSAAELADLRRQASALLSQQERLQDAVRNLVEAGVLGSQTTNEQLRALEAAMRRMEENLNVVAATVASLQRPF